MKYQIVREFLEREVVFTTKHYWLAFLLTWFWYNTFNKIFPYWIEPNKNSSLEELAKIAQDPNAPKWVLKAIWRKLC